MLKIQVIKYLNFKFSNYYLDQNTFTCHGKRHQAKI